MLMFAIVAAVFAAGAFVQTVAGFGSALVIMPLLAYALGVQAAATVMAIVGASVTVAVLYQNRHGFRWREASRLLAGSVIGVPLGTLALKTLPEGPVVAALGIILLAYGLYSLTRMAANRGAAIEAEPVETGGWLVSWCFGFSAGLLGGAYATDGPPLVIYGAVRRWPKESFRSILQACFLVDGCLILLCHSAGGLMSRDILVYSLYGIPGMALGLVAGSLLDRRINHQVFHRLLLWLILVLGTALLARGAYLSGN